MDEQNATTKTKWTNNTQKTVLHGRTEHDNKDKWMISI